MSGKIGAVAPSTCSYAARAIFHASFIAAIAAASIVLSQPRPAGAGAAACRGAAPARAIRLPPPPPRRRGRGGLQRLRRRPQRREIGLHRLLHRPRDLLLLVRARVVTRPEPSAERAQKGECRRR